LEEAEGEDGTRRATVPMMESSPPSPPSSLRALSAAAVRVPRSRGGGPPDHHRDLVGMPLAPDGRGDDAGRTTIGGGATSRRDDAGRHWWYPAATVAARTRRRRRQGGGEGGGIILSPFVFVDRMVVVCLYLVVSPKERQSAMPAPHRDQNDDGGKILLCIMCVCKIRVGLIGTWGGTHLSEIKRFCS